MARPPSLTFLSRLDEAGQQDLLARGRTRKYRAQSILFFEGDDAHDVMVVQAGEIKVSVSIDGREVLLDVLGPGDVLGELSAIDGGPRSATATSLGAASVRKCQCRPRQARCSQHENCSHRELALCT